MKCIHCGADSKYKDRTTGNCPQCRKKFAFEPKSGDRFTDAAFQAAIDAVSAKGQIRWGVEHLYYETCRRVARRQESVRQTSVGIAKLGLVGIGVVGSFSLAGAGKPVSLLALLAVCFGLWRLLLKVVPPMTVGLDQAEFDRLWQKWISAHGNPPGLIVRKSKPAPSRSKESDLGDYSFDRAVICDRARTVDLLIANNFHFENNCAILSIGGYPEGPFELVRTMLKRNPKLHVFALHDASVPGCKLAFTLANDEAWFKGRASVTDVGLRPQHAGPFTGLLLPAESMALVQPGHGIRAGEIEWLGAYALELAAIRPEQILKRLFKAINRREDSSSDSGSGGDGMGVDGGGAGAGGGSDSIGDSFGGGESGGGGASGYFSDDSSFGSDAGDSDGGADSFG